MRKEVRLNILSDNLRDLLVTVKYDLAKVYWQECDEAFGEDKPGNWLSQLNRFTESISWQKDPNTTQDAECGGPKDTIELYRTADSTKKLNLLY